MPYSGFATVPIFLAVGAVAGLLGVAYNRLILGALATAQRLGRWLPGDRRAATVGAAVGLLAWFGPRLVGGGDAITQRTLSGGESMSVVAGVFLVRFGLGPLSYATETPGGLFAPMLALGLKAGFSWEHSSAVGSHILVNARQRSQSLAWPPSLPLSCVLR